MAGADNRRDMNAAAHVAEGELVDHASRGHGGLVAASLQVWERTRLR